MTEVQQTFDLRHLLYPKCPYNNSVLVLVLRLSLIALGTVGLIFFNVWIAVVYLAYSIVWNLLAWPIKHCQYCYYKVKAPPKIDEKTGKRVAELLPLDVWKESYLHKHVECGKKWSKNLFVLWLLPIVLIPISFLFDFSLFAFIILISFIVVLAGSLGYTRWKICPTCAFMEECHASF
ncbi:MAG: hypothetical protein ACW98I_18620 [Candidatus Hodarchaeales archaeon]|jgi:hypothetical protein